MACGDVAVVVVVVVLGAGKVDGAAIGFLIFTPSFIGAFLAFLLDWVSSLSDDESRWSVSFSSLDFFFGGRGEADFFFFLTSVSPSSSSSFFFFFLSSTFTFDPICSVSFDLK